MVKMIPFVSRVLFLSVTTCFVAHFCSSTAEDSMDRRFLWTADREINEDFMDVEEISVDMGSLKAASSSSLALNESTSDIVSLRIDAPALDNVEGCTHLSNKLLLQIDSIDKNAPLICGNEIVPIHTTRFPFKFIFIKGSGQSTSQLNQFNITVGRTEDFPHDKYKDLNVSALPQILYSPFYPDDYTERLDLLTTFSQGSKAVLLQLRSRQTESFAINRVQVKFSSQTVNFYRYELKMVIVDDFYDDFDEEMGGLFYKSSTYGAENYEVEFRSVNINRRWINCKINSTSDVFKEATLVSISYEEMDNFKEFCNVTFSASSTQRIVFTPFALYGGCSSNCPYIRFYIGDQLLPIMYWDYPQFGTIQFPLGQAVTVNVEFNYRESFSFIAQAYEADALPETMVTHRKPSYVWVPGSSSPGEIVKTVLSVRERCVDFSIFDEDLNQQNVSDFVSIYSGSGQSDTFELTSDCVGRRRTDTEINKGHYPVTTIVSESRSPFWLKISKLGDKYKKCLTATTELDISSADTMYSLFSRVSMKKHMDCVFVLNHKASTPNNDDKKIRFRGQLKEPKEGVEFFVKYGRYDWYKDVVVDFRDYKELSGWLFMKRVPNVFFRTQDDVTEDMARFEYGSWYSDKNSVQPNPACPGPLEVNFTDSKHYVFVTPEYPNHLERYMRCVWRLHRPANMTGEYIHVVMENVDSSICWESDVLIYMKDLPGTYTDAQNLRCKETSSRIFPGDAEMHLSQGSEHLVRGIRFNVTLQAPVHDSVCDKTYILYKNRTGMDLNRTFEMGHYLTPFTCRLTVDTRDSGVNIDLHLVWKCRWNYKETLAIYDGADNSSSVLSSNCQRDRVRSSGNSLTIEVTIPKEADHAVTLQMYVKRLETDAHRRTLYASEEIQYLDSGYPKGFTSYSSSLSRRYWEIESTTDQEVEIEITHMNLSDDDNCQYDSIKVYDGSGSASPILATICGTTDGLTFRSSKQTLYVIFLPVPANPTDTYGRFQIKYYTRSQPTPGVQRGKKRIYNGRDDDDDDDSGMDVYDIVIIALVCVLFVLFVLLAVWCVRHRRRSRSNASMHNQTQMEERVQFRVKEGIDDNSKL